MSNKKKQRKKYIPPFGLSKETVQPSEVSKKITDAQESSFEENEQEVTLMRKEHLVFAAIGSGFSIILYLVSFLV